MRFTKLHGCGNSFIILDDRAGKLSGGAALARTMCSAPFGIGADGLILARRSRRADLKMDYYNRDGSRAAMCGNGVRCLATYARIHKLITSPTATIETGAGLVTTHVSAPTRARGTMVTVDVGAPQFTSPDLAPRFHNRTLRIARRQFHFVSMGNPHAITFVKNFDFDWRALGRRIEGDDSIFPNRTNVEFVKILGRNQLQLEVWERGCGATLGCGSGACAAVVAAVSAKLLQRGPTRVSLAGGDLLIDWDEETGHVFMAGATVVVAHGEYTGPFA